VKQLCFILMPFGKKAAPNGSVIDFDRVYGDVIAPAVKQADLEPLRADEETAGGIIHKPMFERLLFCPFAVADLTLANPNVFYELGVRHAFRPWSTVLIISQDNRLPFDVQMLRTIHYTLTSEGVPDPAKLGETVAAIAKFLIDARSGAKDSPIFELVDDLQQPILPHQRTDLFRQQVDYSNQVKAKLATARKQGGAAVGDIENELGSIGNIESGIVIDLMLSYRATKAWDKMIALVDKMAPPLKGTVMVREQLGFALNRAGRRDEAEAVLTNLIEERGPSSETYGILGRVYKDQWEDALKAGDEFAADGFLDRALDAYLKGFEADWRDAYPGVNAVTLMALKNPPDDRRLALIPVVRYSVERKVAKGKPDYWDYATLIELAVLGGDQQEARKMLTKASTCIREKWEPETTARNLRLIREARERQGESVPWAVAIEQELNKRAQS
jgi:tetratricopeptide (TPR) repeat protein